MLVKIKASDRAWRAQDRLSLELNTSNAISYPDESSLRKLDPLHFFRIFKEQPNNEWQSVFEKTFGDALASGFPGGANRDRTGDLLLAKQALSQLSYGPSWLGGSGWS